MMKAPSSARRFPTVVLPEAIPPVSPTRSSERDDKLVALRTLSRLECVLQQLCDGQGPHASRHGRQPARLATSVERVHVWVDDRELVAN